jgi:hypothetical protein
MPWITYQNGTGRLPVHISVRPFLHNIHFRAVTFSCIVKIENYSAKMSTTPRRCAASKDHVPTPKVKAWHIYSLKIHSLKKELLCHASKDFEIPWQNYLQNQDKYKAHATT